MSADLQGKPESDWNLGTWAIRFSWEHKGFLGSEGIARNITRNRTRVPPDAVNNASHVRSGTGIKGRQDMGPESVLATTDEGSELQIIPWNSYAIELGSRKASLSRVATNIRRRAEEKERQNADGGIRIRKHLFMSKSCPVP